MTCIVVKKELIIWILPIVGSIVTIIALFVPVAFTKNFDRFFFFGYRVFESPAPIDISFMKGTGLILSIIIPILLLISAIVAILYGVRGFGKKHGYSRPVILICGIAILFSTIIFTIGIDAFTLSYEEAVQSFEFDEYFDWDIYDPSVGLILPYIGGFLIVESAILDFFHPTKTREETSSIT
ncbi:MAG: hypothetical protein ACFFAK_01600 [Promethearchaeota archaeon]